jgi:hypothetical protein
MFFFEKKEPNPPRSAFKSFLLLFFKKEALPS